MYFHKKDICTKKKMRNSKNEKRDAFHSPLFCLSSEKVKRSWHLYQTLYQRRLRITFKISLALSPSNEKCRTIQQRQRKYPKKAFLLFPSRYFFSVISRTEIACTACAVRLLGLCTLYWHCKAFGDRS